MCRDNVSIKEDLKEIKESIINVTKDHYPIIIVAITYIIAVLFIFNG